MEQHPVIVPNMKDELLAHMWRCGAIQTGDFTLRSGVHSPIYVDIRKLLNDPDALLCVTKALSDKVTGECIAGVPLAGVPLATSVSVCLKKPFVAVRKTRKSHGTKRRVEADAPSDPTLRRCTVIDDVVTKGGSILDTMGALFQSDFNVVQALVVLDRGEGGAALLHKHGVVLDSLLTMDDVLCSAKERGVKDWVKPTHPFVKAVQDRAEHIKSRLVLSADVSDTHKCLSLIRNTADKAVMVKVHLDIMDDAEYFVKELTLLKAEFGFFVCEDRKFADIGNTMRLQADRLPSCVDVVTAHAFADASSISKPVLVVAQMSTGVSYEKYARESLQHENVVGFIAQERKDWMGSTLLFTPGVHASSTVDGSDQRYRTVDRAIRLQQCDFVIVGRGIYKNGAQLHGTPELRATFYANTSHRALMRRSMQFQFARGMIGNAAGIWDTTEEQLLDLAKSDSSWIVSKTCTMFRSAGNPHPRVHSEKEYTLNATGLANEGLQFYLTQSQRLVKSGKPFILSIDGSDVEACVAMLRLADSVLSVDAVEINVSCPNIEGHLPALYPKQMDRLLSLVFGATTRTIGLKLPPYSDVALQEHIASVISKYPVSFIVCCNSVGGGFALKRGGAALASEYGGVSGAVIRPVAMGNIRRFAALLPDIQIVGAGGVSEKKHVDDMLASGAVCVQVGTALREEGVSIFSRIRCEKSRL